MNDRFVVKLTRAWGSSLYKISTKSECEIYARHLNTIYQTDEYKVEAWKEDYHEA